MCTGTTTDTDFNANQLKFYTPMYQSILQLCRKMTSGTMSTYSQIWWAGFCSYNECEPLVLVLFPAKTLTSIML